MRVKTKLIVCTFVGIFIAIFGLVGFIVFETIYWNLLNQEVVLTPDSISYAIWKDLPIPIYLKFYFFNITNSWEVTHTASKPILQEVGPYIYREEHHKRNIKWNDNGTVSYKQIKQWYFEPEMSKGSLNDIIITLNVPLVAATTIVKHKLPILLPVLSAFLYMTDIDLVISKTAKQLIFDGYTDDLLKFAYDLKISPMDKFGWFYQRNNSDDGIFTIFTGKTDVSKFGTVDKWKGFSEVNTWSSYCNKINGSAGDFWPLMRNKVNKIEIFSSYICRSLSFFYSKETKIKNINTLKYYGNEETVDNGRINPENKCFCTGECFPYGALNLSNCEFNAPVILSYPHFLYADPVYLKDVIGLKPNSDFHESYLHLEKDTGLPIEASIKFQISVFLENSSKVRQLSNIPKKTYFPLVWFEETALITDDLAGKLAFAVWEMPFIARFFTLFIFSFGLTCVLTKFVLFWFFNKNDSDKEQLIDDISK